MTATLMDAVIEVLRQGEVLLMDIADVSYARRVPAAFQASVGSHYRHCLDHFRCLFDGLEEGEVNYDDRQRDPRIENERWVAIAHTRSLLRAAQRTGARPLASPLRVRSCISYTDGIPAMVESTLGREAMFCVAHAIHHYAFIAIICQALGEPAPEGFGMAPSTLKHREQTLAA